MARCGKFRQDSQYKKDCKYKCSIFHSVFVYLHLSLLSEGEWCHAVEFLEALNEVAWTVESASYIGHIVCLRAIRVETGLYV